MKVKIWLMHLGENLNGSYFSKEKVEKAIPTLANTPILAYVEDNSSGEKDFSDHRAEIVKEDGKYSYKYLCNGIGVIPESNNAKFETRVGDDGVERTYLTGEGLVWRKWDDPVDIFNRDIFKNQSMELSEKYTGEWKDGLFHFDEFSFFGACALGEDVQPAMVNSSIELQYSLEGIQDEIQTKMEEIKTLFQNMSTIIDDQYTKDKGGNAVDEILKMLEKYNTTLEDLQAKGINHEDFSLEELEEKVKAEFEQQELGQEDISKQDSEEEDRKSTR